MSKENFGEATTCEPCAEEKRSLSLFATERSEDYAAIIGAALVMIITLMIK